MSLGSKNESKNESKGQSKDNNSNDHSSVFFSDKTPRFQSINQILSVSGFGFDKCSITKGSLVQLQNALSPKDIDELGFISPNFQ